MKNIRNNYFSIENMTAQVKSIIKYKKTAVRYGFSGNS